MGNPAGQTVCVPERAIRRSGERELVIVIESADNGALELLQGLSRRTRRWLKGLGYDVSRWPGDVTVLVASESSEDVYLWEERDLRGEIHRFAMVNCGAYDAIFGVSSRRDLNCADGSLNLATNMILRLLGEEDLGDPELRKYGRLVALMPSRLFRLERLGVLIIDECGQWDVEIVTEKMRWDPVTNKDTKAILAELSEGAQGARQLVEGGAAAKMDAHEEGVAKLARATTTPIISIHPESRVMSWDRRVCEATRVAVNLILDEGYSFDQAVRDPRVGPNIPSYRLQAEPDYPPPNRPKVRSRSWRNRTRRNAGLPEVPLRYLEDGSPNPEYRPETILDLPEPGEMLRHLLIGSKGCTREAREHLTPSRVKSDLGGLDPRDVNSELLSTGRYLRLSKDQKRSNRSQVRFRYVEFQLPGYEIGADGEDIFVLSTEEVAALRRLRSTGSATGRHGSMPLIGIFQPDQQVELYTDDGTIHPAGRESAILAVQERTAREGRLLWTTGAKQTDGGRVYRIWFVPDDGSRQGHGSLVIANIPAEDLHPALIKAVDEALAKHPTAARVTVLRRTGSPRTDSVGDVETRLAEAEDRHDAATETLMQPGLTPLTRAKLTEKAAEVEQLVVDLRNKLRQLKSAGPCGAVSGRAPVGNLVDILAILRLPLPLSTEVAEAVQSALRRLVRDARVRVLPREQEVEFELTLVLKDAAGSELLVPVSFRVANQARDRWLAGAAGLMWLRRWTLPEAMVASGLALERINTAPWQRHIVKRLLDECGQHARCWRGPNAANLFVRAPFREVVAVGFALFFGESTDSFDSRLVDLVDDLFFGPGGDLPRPKKCTWSEKNATGLMTMPIRVLLGGLLSGAADEGPAAAEADAA